MIWVPLGVNLFLWTINLVCGLGCAYFFLPAFGGWRTLNIDGKFSAAICVLGYLASSYALITTSVMPI